MSEMEVTEGKLLSQDFGVGCPPAAVEVPPPPRTVETVTLEIRTLQHQAQGIILNYAIEIGRRLEEAKAMLPHGEWGAWLKRELDYSQSTAQNFMRVFREYGDSQQSLFGGTAKSQTFGNLTYSKALRLLAIPDEEERARFAEENDVEHMTTRELNEALKARDAAQEEAAAAQEEVRKLNGEVGRLKDKLTQEICVYESKLTNAGVEANQARAAAKAAQEALEKQKDKAQRLQDALSEANTAAQAAEEEHTRLTQELEELRNRPAEADTEAVEAARKAAIAEMTAKLNTAKDAKKQADQKRKIAEEALEAAKKELAELRAKEPEVRELTQEEKDALTVEAVEKVKTEGAERIQILEKQLAQADPGTVTFKVLFDSWQDAYDKMMEALEQIKSTDRIKAEKLQGAIRKVMETALEQMA